ncbi:unnamed protein product [Sordaria macrospora k-hell]|uniref:WGS project CABT00000000 data, contig 2.32 n=1 Tax=Sordaria macrospora (strain ATCC MYA-333 / DSM 997 / K(L3346) / K-hell) TaxID=771870 RepID=F7W5W0_SORMK|nr:uncharacterized protein SMAC_06040 [Sordaria macrospora k-hell]CCC12898.1 unnamed protein product [Sordaria macrospora k-hell]
MTAAQAAEAAHWFTPSPVANHTTPAKAAESAQRFTPLTIANGTTPAEAIKPGQWSYPLVDSTVWYDTPPAEAAESETGLVPFSTLGFFVDSDLDKGICSTWLTITSEGEYRKKTWCYGRVKKNKLSEHEKAWLKAIRNYRPRFARFFEDLGYDPNWDKWEPERGGVQDRAHARTLVKWFRVHAHPPLVHGGEIMVDLDADIEDDYGLGEAKERLRALRAAGLERSAEARGENIFIQNTTLYLRKLRSEGVEPHFKDIPGARWWNYEEIFGDY